MRQIGNPFSCCSFFFIIHISFYDIAWKSSVFLFPLFLNGCCCCCRRRHFYGPVECGRKDGRLQIEPAFIFMKTINSLRFRRRRPRFPAATRPGLGHRRPKQQQQQQQQQQQNKHPLRAALVDETFCLFVCFFFCRFNVWPAMSATFRICSARPTPTTPTSTRCTRPATKPRR